MQACYSHWRERERPVGKETRRGVPGWDRREEGEGHITAGLGSPACIGLQNQLVPQSGLVGDIKCDREGALREKAKRNGDREGQGGARTGNGSGQGRESDRGEQ